MSSATRIDPKNVLLVVAGGFLGVLARFFLTVVLARFALSVGGFPVATLLENITGAFLLGVLVAWFCADHRALPFLGSGLLGGFTTYSAFALESVTMASAWGLQLAGVYVLLSLVGGLCAAGAGMYLVSRVKGAC